MKVLIDMNLSPKLADILSAKGIPAEHWYKIGAPNAKDTEIIAYAKDNNYAVLTCDLDFSTILALTKGQKPSVVQLRMQVIWLEQTGEMIASAISQCISELESGAILTIDQNKNRLRLLPL